MRQVWPLVVGGGLVVRGLLAAWQGAGGTIPNKRPDAEGDIRMYQAVTARVSAGTPYHRAVAIELPARGYAIRPIFNWRLPTLTWLNALSPSPLWGRVGLWALGLSVIVLCTAAVGRQIPSVTIANAIVVSLATVAIVQVKDATYLHEIWAGLLIAASLSSWILRKAGLSIAFAFLAIAIRELALPYVLIMAVLSWRESNRDKYAWLAIIAMFIAYWSWHASQILVNMPAEGLRNQWLVAGGWPFVLTASRCSFFLMFLPTWLLALLVPIVWTGLWYWKSAAGQRMAVVLTAYFLMFTLAGRTDNWYWGFMVAPLVPLGFFGYFFNPARVRA